jgi:1-deoxy-D-xylulose-5-phosphate reductoisomerase
VEVLTSNNNSELLIAQAKKINPNAVVIADEKKYQEEINVLEPSGKKVFAGNDSLSQIVSLESIDIVLTALVGFAGLKPTLEAITAGKDIALANKETLVVAGELVTKLAKEKRVLILPVDSEHSAIFQCLRRNK